MESDEMNEEGKNMKKMNAGTSYVPVLVSRMEMSVRKTYVFHASAVARTLRIQELAVWNGKRWNERKRHNQLMKKMGGLMQANGRILQ